jgi:hypothetical protein
VGTFNVNGKLPGQNKLGEFFKINIREIPEIYVIGVQELIELSAEQVNRKLNERFTLFTSLQQTLLF